MRKAFFNLVLLLGVAGCVVAWFFFAPLTPPPAKAVLLHPGFSQRRIASELQAAGVIRSKTAFLLWEYLQRRTLKAGEYLFDKPASMAEVYDRIVRGDIYFHSVTIPEGYTMFDVAQAIEVSGLGSSADFLEVARKRTDLIADLAPDARSLEGYLFPETYQFTRTQSLADMAGMMVRKFRQVAHQIGLTGDIQRTVTMASIVEKETAAPEERPEVASVYFNRLKQNIGLDADPSVIYAELLSGKYQGALHHEDMRFDSPYNTYRYAGLPPGPIANPGRSSLEAAMHPAQTDYLYFVSGGNGHHRFARSLEEHNRNVEAYRRAVATK